MEEKPTEILRVSGVVEFVTQHGENRYEEAIKASGGISLPSSTNSPTLMRRIWTTFFMAFSLVSPEIPGISATCIESYGKHGEMRSAGPA